MVAEALAVLAPFTVMTPQGAPAAQFEMGAAEGPQYPSLYINGGDIVGPRNLQGGDNHDHDFDIGAGSTTSPGILNFNFDIGRQVNVWDGLKGLRAKFTRRATTLCLPSSQPAAPCRVAVVITERGITFKAPVTFEGGTHGR